MLVGDDPEAKSSTVPCATERTLASLGPPVMFPRNSEELISFGLRGIALSRASGCWVGMKSVVDVADGFWTVDSDFSSLTIALPPVSWNGRPWTYQQRIPLGPSHSLVAEADLVGPRWTMVEAFASANPFDQIELDTTDAWCGFACVGPAFDHNQQALRKLGLDDAALRRAGVRLLRIGMPYPLAGPIVRDFAKGLRELVVIGARAARKYVDFVQSAAQAERRETDETVFSAAVARGLHRFMAYKDEYEVARLLTESAGLQAIAGQVPGAKRLAFNLHPPMLRAAGMRRKIKLGPTWHPLLRALARGRALRGHWYDPFGHTGIRRIERALIDDYVELVEQLARDLSTLSVERAAAAADTAELVRGFEGVKMRNVLTYIARRAEFGYPLGAALADLLDQHLTGSTVQR